MNLPQRLVLFSLILGLAPKNYLELGTARGGSALIVQKAIQCLGNPDFQGACIDVSFSRISPEHKTDLERHFRFIEASISVSSIIRAHRAIGDFEIVLIDALHDIDNARFDAMTVFPFVRPGGVILFDDANYFEVRDAIREIVTILPVEDCGYLSRHGGQDAAPLRPENDRWRGEEIIWGGLYMLRKKLGSPSASEAKSGPLPGKFVVPSRKY
ncbi:class I SAM-dependent methyltransferase [Crenalkalicoccus roseus]|uniref:class I SAM-dependent methyltransferase n=1 Tax=Crenalkalicoccus roseus TaxID=1485588 RepID=UPI0019598FCE|nr:class I SAM-dependent methyltransferase [Crenalkalicoccus roseus]